MFYLDVFITMLFGYVLGRDINKLYKKIDQLHKRMDKQEVGPTLGTYGPINSLPSTYSETGISQPKTPAQLEWEEAERLREAQIK
jgi:hypothetical protein